MIKFYTMSLSTKVTIFFIMFMPAVCVSAQTADSLNYFKVGGFASFTFNQVNLSNWAAGGENAVALTAILNLFSKYQKGNISWDNNLDLGYGTLKSGSSNTRISEDKIEFNSKYGYKAFGNFFYSALFNYRTQFGKGYNYPNDSVIVSKFNAPGYVSLSLGLDYKPNQNFSLFVSPVAGRITIVSDQRLADLGAYGVDSAVYENGIKIKDGKTTRAEFGATLNARYQRDIIKNVNLLGKVLLFNNYTDKDKANRKNIDVNLEVMLNIKAGKFLTTSILANLIYDQNTIAKTQFKEMLGVGLSFKF